MSQLYLVAEIAGTRFAMPADTVESVVTASDIIPVPRAAPTVAGIAALRSKVITVIDTRAAINGSKARIAASQLLIVAKLDDFLYGLAVDKVHDVCEYATAPRKLGAAFEPGWRRVSTGIIELDGAAIVVLNPATLVAGSDSVAA
ncbi:chemotaxis protein CheW [Parasphingopyxis sp.]|uniref:chemotaxis protein CheW n=1 Tax=Parasphingopyxis sp. TaxID=1920299 RepID=UPI002636CB24|nr:chemotaxis protein CheW [Parasphingopyxis sp.]